jgi:hypothetical protein
MKIAGYVRVSSHQQMELASLMSSIVELCQRISRGLSQATLEQKRQLGELLIDRVVVTMEEVEIRSVIPTSLPVSRFVFVICLQTISVLFSERMSEVASTGGLDLRPGEERMGYGRAGFPLHRQRVLHAL